MKKQILYFLAKTKIGRRIIFKINPPSKYQVVKHMLNDIEKPIIIDVGANEGQTIDSILLLMPSSSIYSFEPTKKLFAFLQKKYSDKVKLYNLALSSENGEVTFFESDYTATNSLLEYNNEIYDKFDQSSEITRFPNLRKETVNTIKLSDWYYNNIDGEIIDLLKIDVQGGEFSVLKGGESILQNNVKMILFEIQYLEFYKNEVPFYKILEFLYDNGFYFICSFPETKIGNIQLIESDILCINKKYFDYNYFIQNPYQI